MNSTPKTNSPAPPEPFIDERAALRCVHCGLCLAVCPTYLETGDENHSPRGRIYLMRQLQSGRAELGATTVQPVDACLGCLACQPACPANVNYADLLDHTRHHIERHHRRPAAEVLLRRWLIEFVFPHPWRMRLGLAGARLARTLRLQKVLPEFMRKMVAMVPTEMIRQNIPPRSPATVPETRGRVGFLTGCVQSVMFGGTNNQCVALLNRAGYEVVTPAGQTCCGALYAHLGDLEEARACARRNIAVFEALNLDYVLTGGSGCGFALKEYGHLLRDDPAWAQRAAAFSSRVRELVELLPPRPSGNGLSQAIVTYHESCHLAHAQGIRREPRAILRAVCGERFVELPESDLCCGSAGSYNLTQPEMADRLQRRKTANILRTGATIVVTTNPGCLLQIRAGLAAAGRPDIAVMHLADFLATVPGAPTA
ncbi:MAG: 4Fe-4S dicluster domain-containing protein [Lentisphaerae bacterium]|nr:4Fe-4S dicluster domain-containing protein [Lentisphaerota bacterium]